MTIPELLKIKEQYIKNRLVGNTSIDFIKILADNGYTEPLFSLEESRYYLKNLNPEVHIFTDGDMSVARDMELSLGASHQNAILIGNTAAKTVWVGMDAQINTEYCDANNVPHFNMPYRGGAICILPEDIDGNIIMNNPAPDVSSVLLDKLTQMIAVRTKKNTVNDGNDILIDGKKVCGTGYGMIENTMLYGFHISFECDAEFISNVCIKESIKAPSGITEFGTYNRLDMIEEIISWLHSS